MLRIILIYGAIAGVIVGVPLFATTALISGPLPYAMAIGYLTMLIALSAVFLGVKQYRDTDLGGVIKFWPAFGMGLAISAVASVIYVAVWEATLVATGMDFGGDYTRALIAEQKAKGMSGEALTAFAAEMEAFAAQYADPLYRLPMTFTEIFPVGVLVSLITAGMLRNRSFLPVRRA